MLRLSILVMCALSLGGCYLVHERVEAAVPDAASPDAATIDAAVVIDAAPEIDAAVPPCAPPPTTPCTAWEVAGEPAALLDGPPGRDVFREIADAVQSECSVVVMLQSTLDRRTSSSVSFASRRLDWSGARLDLTEQHDPITMTSVASSGMELAARPSDLAGVVDSANGCVLTPFDTRGADRAAPVSLGASPCIGLSGDDTGYSFLATSGTGSAPASLDHVDADGRARTSTPLAIPDGRTVWSRTNFSDGSFLVYTFEQRLPAVTPTSWLQHFAASGAALGPAQTITNHAAILVAATSTGAIVTWTDTDAGNEVVLATDHDGAPLGDPHVLPLHGALYASALTATPDDGALLVWLEQGGEPATWGFWIVFAVALDATGAPRAAPTMLLRDVSLQLPHLLVEESGERALVLYTDSEPAALPLRCRR